MPRLTENIISVFRNVYGLAGDEVKVISDHGDVMIVEGVDGNRFSVNINKLTCDNTIIESKPIEHIKNQKQEKKRKLLIQHQNQSSLF